MSKLCDKCILPSNYVGVKFNDVGLCNFCENDKPITYQGKEKLINKVNVFLQKYPRKKYDCIVGLSGGRDSTFLLWYVVKELKLNPLAVFINSNLIPDQTFENISMTTKILNVDLKIIEHNFLKKAFRHHFYSWLKRPVPETLINFCVGCRLGIHKGVVETAIENDIHVLFLGGTPFEGKHYKTNIVKLNSIHESSLSFILGYLRQVIYNPRLIMNFFAFKTQIREYYWVEYKMRKLMLKHNIAFFPVFNKYIHWQEKLIEEILVKELNWKTHPELYSSYRGDCEIGIVRQFFYYKMLGYNDKDDHLSCLIRDGQITREDAIKRIEKERFVPIEILQEVCQKSKIPYSEIEKMISEN